MKKILSGAVAVVLAAVAFDANAQTTFGGAGQLAIDAQGGVQLYSYPWGVPGADLNDYGMTPFVGWSFRKVSEPNINNGPHNDSKTSVFYLNPGADYFVIDHLSIGGEVLFAITGTSVTRHVPNGADRTDDGPGGTHFGFMPRIGYDIPIGSMFSIWPRGGIGWRHASFSGGGIADFSLSAWFFYADVPFMFHFAEHFFAGIGPGFTVTLASSVSGSNRSQDWNGYTDIRLLSTVLGGWI